MAVTVAGWERDNYRESDYVLEEADSEQNWKVLWGSKRCGCGVFVWSSWVREKKKGAGAPVSLSMYVLYFTGHTKCLRLMTMIECL
jgi:hypothetical protein